MFHVKHFYPFLFMKIYLRLQIDFAGLPQAMDEVYKETLAKCFLIIVCERL